MFVDCALVGTKKLLALKTRVTNHLEVVIRSTKNGIVLHVYDI